MAQHDEDFPVGSKVRVADASVLEHFLRPNWVYHHPLDPANLRLAGSVQVIASIASYHGGDVLYELEGAPGQWHEACLLRADDQGSRNTEAMLVEAERELHAILRMGHETSIRGSGLSLRDALSQTRYREIRPALDESLLVTHLKDDPSLIEEWLLYSEDKRTDGGWYLLRDATIGQVHRRGEEIRFSSLEQAVAAHIVRELDFWANLSPST